MKWNGWLTFYPIWLSHTTTLVNPPFLTIFLTLSRVLTYLPHWKLEWKRTSKIVFASLMRHSVWKSKKKSHSTLRVSGQEFIKSAKNGFLKTWSWRSNSINRQVIFNRTKIGGKCQNPKYSNATFWVIFKQCILTFCRPFLLEYWRFLQKKVEGDFVATSCVQKISLGEKAVSLKEIPWEE